MFQAWWPMEGERKTPFHLFPLSPQQTLLKLSIFSFDLTILLYHGSRPLFSPFFPFLRSKNYGCAPQCNKSFTPSLLIYFDWKSDLFPFLEIMASCMVTSYEPQAVEANEKPFPKSSLNLTLTQHLRDEEPEPWEVHARLEVEPPRA
jgi:hypothetical protein